MKVRFAVIALSLLAVLIIGFAGSSSASYIPPFSSAVTLPSYATTGQNVTFYVNDSLGFNNYTVTVYISGENLTGASPSTSYHTTHKSDPDFAVSLKMPSSPQTVYVTVVSGANYSSHYVHRSYSYTVNVIAPIIFYATVSDTGTVAIHNLTVDFTVDGQFVGTATASYIPPGGSYTVNFTYVNPYLTDGEHTLTVSVNNPAVSIDGSTGSYTTHFYYGSPPNYDWIYYVAAVVVAFMIFLAMTAGRRSNLPNRPKWRK
ncbi:MAG: hypothetical protein M1431_06010 [Candidatus Thermoplasmatota archaeon]|nr:hypothetical protein [Candidatus Thermoplasmatota archaeon]